jgi:hypothetical protein
MPDFNVRSDSVNVEQIMEQIRARIKEKRGADYTEQQIQELAAVKLEKFLDPRGVRSDLLDQFRRARPPYTPPDLPNYAFEEHTLFESHRAPLRLIRRLLQPILKLFFNPNPLIQALHIQSKLNTAYAEREARREAERHGFDQLHYEVMHNLVVETTRLGIEVKNLKMRVESLTSRLEFNERRARALETAVVYKPSPDEHADTPFADMQTAEPSATSEAQRSSASVGSVQPEGPGQRSRRRRRRRGRRGSGSVAAAMTGTSGVPPGAGLEGQPQAGQAGQSVSEPASSGESAPQTIDAPPLADAGPTDQEQ